MTDFIDDIADVDFEDLYDEEAQLADNGDNYVYTDDDWLLDLGDGFVKELDASGIDDNPEAAAICIAALRHEEDGTTSTVCDIRGEGAALAECVGRLVYNADIPHHHLLLSAARKAIELRDEADRAAAAHLIKESDLPTSTNVNNNE